MTRKNVYENEWKSEFLRNHTNYYFVYQSPMRKDLFAKRIIVCTHLMLKPCCLLPHLPNGSVQSLRSFYNLIHQGYECSRNLELCFCRGWDLNPQPLFWQSTVLTTRLLRISRWELKQIDLWRCGHVVVTSENNKEENVWKQQLHNLTSSS